MGRLPKIGVQFLTILILDPRTSVLTEAADARTPLSRTPESHGPTLWWNYQHREMTGLFIRAWSGLPVEGVCVWIAVTYATVIVFEVVKVWLASERSAGEAFMGKKRNAQLKDREALGGIKSVTAGQARSETKI